MSLNIQKIKLGKASVFKEVVEQFWPRMFKFCIIYTSDPEVSKDIIQEAFLSLWENRQNLTDETELITYLMVVCRNKCYNYLRKRQFEFVSDSELTDEEIYLKASCYTLENESSELLDTLDLHSEIEKALSTLRPRTREIFRLKYYEGMKVNEISERTNLAGKTVEYHLRRALKVLQSKLSPAEFYLILFLIN